jgi:hypothetical protein
MIHDFVNVWLPGALTGAAIATLVTWLIATRRRPKAPRLQIGHGRPHQHVDVALFGQDWTGVVERVDFDVMRQELRVDLISQRAFEERYRLPSEGTSP